MNFISIITKESKEKLEKYIENNLQKYGDVSINITKEGIICNYYLYGKFIYNYIDNGKFNIKSDQIHEFYIVDKDDKDDENDKDNIKEYSINENLEKYLHIIVCNLLKN